MRGEKCSREPDQHAPPCNKRLAKAAVGDDAVLLLRVADRSTTTQSSSQAFI